MSFLRNSLIVASLVFGSAGTALAADTFKIDPDHTRVVFFVNHFGYSNVMGHFTDLSGTFTFDQENVTNSSVNLVIKASSVDTDHEKRNAHLRSPDFLNAEEFPEITFKSTSVEKTGDNTGKITGDLTVLGQTKPATLDVTFNKIAPHPIPFYEGVIVAGFSARTKVNRIDYGMTYGQGGIGDVLDLFIEVEGHKQ